MHFVQNEIDYVPNGANNSYQSNLSGCLAWDQDKHELRLQRMLNPTLWQCYRQLTSSLVENWTLIEAISKQF